VRALRNSAIADPSLSLEHFPRRSAIAHNDEFAADVGCRVLKITIVVLVLNEGIGEQQDEAVGTVFLRDDLSGGPTARA
jgi:hypothetical protein